ncbi:hydrogenase maturation peptidase HycI [Pyrococcus abyssi]|uniref:Hydrogenase maturation protease n=1 Tax=Pyrococcus abyssi (strain GE5 / Orsay) TaxID=272844 RepID=Q9V0D1_PYRAB|nr:hydrogenase maturation peptidase HycI [Pyrococcus abyssi]CAB49773.1 Hydrogenase maturation protease [Pyrococcus abyssi GE5]CCE70264.1 TPA: putative hydrogenase maturation protease [Pyrococcus abyssi GE5]
MRVVICCIGNELKGDDAFGILVYERLKYIIKDKAIIINCGNVPENYLGKIINANPDLVILVDAVHFGGKVGELVIVDPEETLGEAFSTHSLPLKFLTRFIKENTNAKVLLLGCQPRSVEFLGEVSEEVKESVEKAVNYIIKLLHNSV